MARTNKVGKVATRVNLDDNGRTGSVQYHYTTVVEWTAKEIFLNSGGWRTATTKLRINQASNEFGLGFQVFQKDHCWYVEFKGKTIDFEDNMKMKRG